MLSLKQVLGNYTKNVNATEVHNPPSSENDFGGQAGAARRVDDSSESLTGFRQRRISLRLNLSAVAVFQA